MDISAAQEISPKYIAHFSYSILTAQSQVHHVHTTRQSIHPEDDQYALIFIMDTYMDLQIIARVSIVVTIVANALYIRGIIQ
jgi:hypothetical protein